MKIKSIIVKNIFFLLLFSIHTHGEIKEAGEYLKSSVVQRVLPNGINVIMLNRGYAPTLALLISFKVGSVNESYETIGIAHMLEHMLFKGTDVIGTTDFKKEKVILDEIEQIGEKINDLKLKNPASEEIEKLEVQLKKLEEDERQYILNSPYSKIYAENGGIGFNAFTSKDMTVYVIELPASKFEIWAGLESERLRNPVFREFYIEKKAVLEERLNSYESRGEGILFEQFIANAYIAHPYRHPIIGWKSNIEHFSIKDVKNFYRKNYIPSRMTITVVGKQDIDKTYKLLGKYFGTLENIEVPREITTIEPEQKGERRFEYYFDSNPYILIGWHKPTYPSRVDYIFDMIELLLSGGQASRLNKSLVIQKGLAASIDAWNGYPGARYDNLFMIATMPKYPTSAETLENAIYEEIDKLVSDLSDEEMKKVLNQQEASFIFQMDDNMGIARMLSYYQTNFDDWKYAVNYLDVLKTINKEEIKDAIKNYLTKENRTVGILRNSAR